MSKLIEEMGPAYFADKFSGAYFIYDSKLVQLQHQSSESFVVIEASDDTSVEHRIPFDYFQGFSVFKWPTLGYRRLSENVIARVRRQGNGTSGLRPQGISKEYTPLSKFLKTKGLARQESQIDLMKAVFFPQFDSLDLLDLLFAGEHPGLVINENVVVEPSLRTEDEVFDVLYQGNPIATLTPDRVVSATTAANKNYVRSVLNV